MPSWFPWGAKPPPPSPLDKLPKLPKDKDEVVAAVNNSISSLQERIASLPPNVLAGSAFALGVVSSIGVSRIHARFFRRIRSEAYVTPDVLKSQRWIKGYVTRSVLYLHYGVISAKPLPV